MNGIDHLVYTSVNLEQGLDEIEKLLGVRPVYGGQHSGFGTHNALLSLGQTTYLEVIAPDPELTVPEQGLPFGMDGTKTSRLATWAYRIEEIETLHAAAFESDLDLGRIIPGKRQKADGNILSWKLTDPNAMLLDGAVPFLISWGISPHPATSVPRAGDLTGFRIEHPQSSHIQLALEILGVEMGAGLTVEKASNIKLVVSIKTEWGDVALY